MRIDAITIFPEYLEPLRHALLGKAIEDGHLAVGVHDLRDWATGAHRSVDARPAGGGPGMVMKPEVWGPALDDVAAGRVEGGLSTAVAHKSVARHDELAGVDKHLYAAGDRDTRPLLLVPTPAGKPFTQEDARAWSREEHIVFACGRYEGIDQRVFDDAEQRYRVREVSIGDYVLIGGEVAVLVITEAVVRLIPGVLGNQDSHLEDSFSDGLLEGPSYTRPREWRGLEVPEVLLGGDHKKIEAYRRRESLRRTRDVRPDLLDAAELSRQDRFMLNSRAIHTDLNVLLRQREWDAVAAKLSKKLRKAGYEVTSIHAEPVDLTCEPDNMLLTQYLQAEGAPPREPVLRILINGVSDLELREATRVVVKELPGAEYWYGTSDEGEAEPGIAAACAWQHP
ncbi:tRNA (guanosine(37)-N1)-methyltransferase TrmD [Corynebacterium doosanense]|uniref:tRNA (guanosine(37)-N1)-methyltransferase TrmD n=1 Tax=Corynebacterium doosanense TaxID=1121358 RepID=UPI0003662424|nr:tRNA (guanosine(37)-N1)-methyltransferase TrmD [Corynebacterium doosanense]